MATQVTALPEDALAGVFRALPLRSLAAVRCVCKAWRDLVDGRWLPPLERLLPLSVRGVFINYIDHERPHHFARPCSSSSSSSTTVIPRVDGMLSFLPNDDDEDWWSVLDHCSGLLLCDIEWGSQLCVCNPATRRWTVLPHHDHDHGGEEDGSKRYRYAGAYMAFDPAASPHYQVILIPEVPKGPSAEDRRRAEKERRALLWRKKERHAPPFCLDWLFSSADDVGGDDPTFGEEEEEEEEKDEEEEEEDQVCNDKEFQQQLEHQLDPCRLMEWPPTTWELRVFSSSTGAWEKRDFGRRESTPAAGVVEKMRLDSLESTIRRRYAVYHHGSLFVHCQGSFVARLSMSNNEYQVIETPANIEYAKPYLGKLQESVCFGIVHDQQLNIWILNEPCGQMEWILKYEAKVGHYAQYVASIPYDYNGRQEDGSWIVEENNGNTHNSHDVQSQPENSYEWDSDNDDTFTVDTKSQEISNHVHLDIMGFHPCKEVVFLVQRFGVVAYHLNSNKVQHLGNSRPKCYYHSHCNGIYESFLYTPCMTGHLLHGDQPN